MKKMFSKFIIILALLLMTASYSYGIDSWDDILNKYGFLDEPQLRALSYTKPPNDTRFASGSFGLDGEYTNVDMLLGNLFFTAVDLRIQGRNGMNIEFVRMYNSSTAAVGSSTENEFCVGSGVDDWFLGSGWHWPKGWTIDPVQEDATINYGNGASEELWMRGSSFRTRSRKTLSSNKKCLMNIDGSGTVYDFEYDGPGSWDGNHTTQEYDPSGNSIYYAHEHSVPLISSMTDSSRFVWFEYSSVDSSATAMGTTRLKKIKYLNWEDDTLEINYFYDLDDDDTTYMASQNPLVMVAYPNDDTVRYAYTDSAKYGGGYENFSYLKLSEVIVPSGDTIKYDWEVFRETRDMGEGEDDRYFWHVNVSSIRIAHQGGDIDTIDFDFDYNDQCLNIDAIYSHVMFPDSSAKVYYHSPIHPIEAGDFQDAGLLDKILYFDKLPTSNPDYANAVYALEVGFDGKGMEMIYSGNKDSCGYFTDTLGIDVIETPAVYITAPVRWAYTESYDCIPGDEPLSYSFKPQTVMTGFNSDYGKFQTIRTDSRQVDNYYASFIYNSPWLYSDSIKTIGCEGADEDTVVTHYHWDSVERKPDTVTVVAAGKSQKSIYDYDDFGNMIMAIKPLGDTTWYEYSVDLDSIFLTRLYNTTDYDFLNRFYHLNSGQLEYSVNPNGDTTYFYYDTENRLIAIQKPMESATSAFYKYDVANRIVTDSVMLDSSLSRVSYRYADGLGRNYKNRIIDEEHDSVMTWSRFDERNRVISSARPYSSSSDTIWVEYEYNILDKLVKATYPDGESVSAGDSTDSDYLYSYQNDILGRESLRMMDSTMKVIKIVSDTLFKDTVEYSYYPFGRVKELTDPRGLKTKFWYDGFGNIVSDSSADEGRSYYYFDSQNRLRFTNDYENNWTYVKYDLHGRLVESGTHPGIDTTYVDTLDYPDSATAVLSTYKYDSYNSGYEPTDSSGFGPLSALDNPYGKLTEIDDKSGRTWFYYDDRGRLGCRAVQIDGLTDTLSMFYTYGAGDQLIELTYPDSSEIDYEYYDTGRLKKIPGYFDVDGAVGVAGFEYEPWGAISKMNHHDSLYTTTFEYDSLLIRPTKIFCQYDTTKLWGQAYSYNDARMIDTVRALDDSGDPLELERTYEYDYLYRLIDAGIDSSTSIRYGYDQSGNRSYKVVDGATTDSVHYYLQYDSLVTYDYTPYDTVELLIEGAGGSDSDYLDPNATDSVIWSCSFGPDNYGSYFRIIQDGDTLVDASIDNNGRFALSSSERVYIYLYTRCSKKGEGCNAAGTAIFYQRNTNVEYTNFTNKINYVTGQSSGNYQWDDNGCLIENSEDNTEYFFDAFNRLDSVEVDGVKRLEFLYDASGRRVKKISYTGTREECDSADICDSDYNTWCEPDSGTSFFVCGDANGDNLCIGSDITFLVLYLGGGPAPSNPKSRGDVSGDGLITGPDVTYLVNYFRGGPDPECCYWLCNDTLETYYIYSGSQVVAEYDQDGELVNNYLYAGSQRLARFNGSTKQYYINDIRGSVAQIRGTSDLGTPPSSSSLKYYPFGSVQAQSGSSHLKYTGKEQDDYYGFDLYYYGARYYDSDLGRFISPDPVRNYYNLYSYCYNDPINFYDPDGRDPDLRDPYGDRWMYEAGGAVIGGVQVILLNIMLPVGGPWFWGLFGTLSGTAAGFIGGEAYDDRTRRALDNIAQAFGVNLTNTASYNQFIQFCIDKDIPLDELRGKSYAEIKAALEKAGLLQSEKEKNDDRNNPAPGSLDYYDGSDPDGEGPDMPYWSFDSAYGGAPR
ncbi:MAG: hypothetical protein GY839_12310 [candidate division Zixibacteria bacterium]|nr:hypothetical protein [candidate division Zixibacteria bacterium]